MKYGLATLVTLCGLGLPAFAQQATQPEDTYAVREVMRAEATRQMVAAAHPRATQTGLEILRAGGSAADAAVAIQMMLNLVEPQSSGIGGGIFIVYWDASEGRLVTIDGRETAPLDATPQYWLGADGEKIPFPMAVPGGRSVGTPGTLAAIEHLHQKHGRLPWPDLLAPAITTAKDGFEVSPRLHASIAAAKERALPAFPDTRAYFYDPAGEAWPVGHVLKNPGFAQTLRLIAAHGSAPFYQGVIAGDIVAKVRAASMNPGILTLDDLDTYIPIERDTICAPYRAYEICGMGPPSSGALTIGQIMMMLEGFDLAALGDTPEMWHLFAEASRLAFADRGLYMADVDYVDMPQGLLNADYLATRRALIDPAAAMTEKAEAGEPPWDEAALRSPDTQTERPGTSHFVIVDSYGDMASITTTIEAGFGSRLMVGGFLLNNELTDFSFNPGTDEAPVANRVEPGKRPRSSMAPTVVLQEGRPVLLIGSPGGSRIIPYVAANIVRILDLGMDPAEALGKGHITNRNGATELEEGTEAAALAPALEALGHEVKIRNLNSGLHVIDLRGETLVGAADPRREGTVLGD